jgi:hypothetical protein
MYLLLGLNPGVANHGVGRNGVRSGDTIQMDITHATFGAALIVVVPALTRLLLALFALRGTTPAQRPEILRALRPISFGRGDAAPPAGDDPAGTFSARDP